MNELSTRLIELFFTVNKNCCLNESEIPKKMKAQDKNKLAARKSL